MLLASRSLFNLLESSHVAEQLNESIDRDANCPGYKSRKADCDYYKQVRSFETYFFHVIEKALFALYIDAVD